MTKQILVKCLGVRVDFKAMFHFGESVHQSGFVDAAYDSGTVCKCMMTADETIFGELLVDLDVVLTSRYGIDLDGAIDV